MRKKNKLPVILQAEIAECGLTCLAMLFAYYRYPMSLTALRQQVGSTIYGTTLADLKKIAEENGFSVLVLRVEMTQLALLNTPCLMHWDMNHYVVLQAVTKKNIIIHDPLLGRRVFSYVEAAHHVTGIILEMRPPQSILAIKWQNHTNKIITGLVKNHSLTLVMLIVISFFIQGCYVGSVFYIKKTIDQVFLVPTHQMIIYLLLIFFGAKLLECAAIGMRHLMLTATGVLVNHNVGFSFVEKLMALPLSFFDSRHLSDILSRFAAVEKIRSALTEGLVEGLVDGLVSLMVLAMMFYLNKVVALIALLFAGLFFLLRIYSNQRIRQYQEKSLQIKTRDLAHLMETIRAMTAIKLFAREKDRLHGWRNKYVNSLNVMTRMSWHKIFFDSWKHILFSLDLFFTLLVSCLLLQAHKISLGVLYAHLACRQQFMQAIGSLADKWQEYGLLKLHLHRLGDIMQASTEPSVIQHECDLANGDLTVENVAFAYTSLSNDVLTDVNIKVKQGECVAITGPSGCGKTTLLKIMLGLLPPCRGSIMLADTSIYPQHVVCYRKKIAVVLQEDILLSGTIFENITFFANDPDMSLVHYCAELVGMIDEINALPMRFYTLMNEMGSALSGGQKQRILLARALYAKPTILFLDEATSHLDAKKEQAINLAIKSLGITVIMIAHRQETIAMADRVIMLGGDRESAQ